MPADFRSGWSEPYPLEKWLPSADNLRNSDAAFDEWLAGVYSEDENPLSDGQA